jgi:hypothetical protein
MMIEYTERRTTYFPPMRITKFGSLMIDGLFANVSNDTRCALKMSSVINDCLFIFPQSES